MKNIKVCVDCYIPQEKLAEVAILAKQEDPTNVLVGIDTAPDPSKMALYTAKKWATGRTIKMAFMGGSQASRNIMTQASEEVAKYANLKFQITTSLQESELRWSFVKGQGAYSFIGSDCLGIAKNQATGNLGWDDLGTSIHELCHAVGMIHEHQSPVAGIPWKLANVYRFYGGPPNNWDRATIDSNVIRKYSDNEITQFTKFDKTSIMLYPLDASLLTDPSFATGWNTQLSDLDKQFLTQIYPGTPVEPPTDPDSPDVSPINNKDKIIQYTKDIMVATDEFWNLLDDKTRRIRTALK